jgi:HTH-type transcriptional regulator/antitoxin MqsA
VKRAAPPLLDPLPKGRGNSACRIASSPDCAESIRGWDNGNRSRTTLMHDGVPPIWGCLGKRKPHRMTNPRNYPSEMASAESGRPMRRGVKQVTIHVDGRPFTYGQPGWWCSLDDPDDMEGQLVDDDNVVRSAALQEARAWAKDAVLSPLAIRAIREQCGLSQKDAARVFGGGPKAFEKYEAGEVVPSAAMNRLLFLAAQRPQLFRKGRGGLKILKADAAIIRDTVRKSSVDRIWQRIYGSRTRRSAKRT